VHTGREFGGEAQILQSYLQYQGNTVVTIYYKSSLMEKIIHFTVSENISRIETEVIARARELHPSWEIKVWQDPVKKNNFLLEGYWEKTKSGAQFADLLRLDLLYRFGGVYVDGDLRLFRPLDSLIERFEFFIASEDGVRPTNALMGARKDSPVLRYLIDHLRTNEPDWNLPPNVTTGPDFLSHHLRWRNDVTLLPREVFYPYNWDHVGQKKIHRHSYGEHLWMGSWFALGDRSALSSKSARHGWLFLRDQIRQQLKKCLGFCFSVWHRVKSINRIQPPPQVRSYQCSDDLVVQTIHGFRIIVDGKDVSLTPQLVFKGYSELPEENFLKNTVRGGDWVIDVGANIGSFSLLAAQQVGPFGRVFAYEPNPRPVKLMAKSLVMNRTHDRVVQRPVAVGSSCEISEFTFIADRVGDGEVALTDVTGTVFAKTVQTLGLQSATKSKVPCVRLDDEFRVDLPIKLLKVNVDGYEDRVLAGAERLLKRRCIDFVVMKLLEEVGPSRWQEALQEVRPETLHQIKKVIEFGYAICALTNEGVLVEQRDLFAAIRTRRSNVVLAAREQYQAASPIIPTA